MGRRLSAPALRQALTVALMGVGLVIAGTLMLLTVTRPAPIPEWRSSVSADSDSPWRRS